MVALQQFKKDFSAIDFREKRAGVYKVLLPFFYEDGDMYDIFIEDCPDDKSAIRISDHGLTLMKLSYDFDIDTPNKQKILEGIISQNRCFFNNGNIYLDVAPEQLTGGIYQFAQTITKVSNMDIISKEYLKSCFYEFLGNFIFDAFKKYNVKKDVCPVQDKDLKVDFEIPAKKPFYIFGVNDNAKASKVIISCLSFASKNIPFKSLVVLEDIEALTKFNRNQLINVSDKPFTDLEAFKEKGPGFIEREMA
jgi:hypothetical protein